MPVYRCDLDGIVSGRMELHPISLGNHLWLCIWQPEEKRVSLWNGVDSSPPLALAGYTPAVWCAPPLQLDPSRFLLPVDSVLLVVRVRETELTVVRRLALPLPAIRSQGGARASLLFQHPLLAIEMPRPPGHLIVAGSGYLSRLNWHTGECYWMQRVTGSPLTALVPLIPSSSLRSCYIMQLHSDRTSYFFLLPREIGVLILGFRLASDALPASVPEILAAARSDEFTFAATSSQSVYLFAVPY